MLEFTEAVTLEDCDNVDLSSGTCVGAANLSGNVYEVELSGADENDCLTLELVDVASDASSDPLVGVDAVRVVVLRGDVNASGEVDIDDVSETNAHLGHAVAAGTFRYDVNADGTINVQDLVIISNNQEASASCTLPASTWAWVYTWDAENRLIGAAPGSPGAGAKKVAFGYDYMGRRVRKAVYAWDTGGSQWESTPMLDERYVYDGWNVVLVLDGNASNAVTRRYTWGLDLSGQGAAGFSPRGSSDGATAGLHGAGGIGGLLAVVETQGTATTADDEHFWFLYDGNGNVGQLLRYAAQANPPVTLAAHYEYDPYGQTLTVHDADASGYAAANPLRFSTKWFDAETGLGYWGYRYYAPELGRWMSRDPMEEEGGLNLLVFAFNNPANATDAVGLAIIDLWARGKGSSFNRGSWYFKYKVTLSATFDTESCCLKATLSWQLAGGVGVSYLKHYKWALLGFTVKYGYVAQGSLVDFDNSGEWVVLETCGPFRSATSSIDVAIPDVFFGGHLEGSVYGQATGPPGTPFSFKASGSILAKAGITLGLGVTATATYSQGYSMSSFALHGDVWLNANSNLEVRADVQYLLMISKWRALDHKERWTFIESDPFGWVRRPILSF